MTTQTPAAEVHDRSIGNIIAKANNLSAEQVEQILQYQRNQGVRFGEAAVALGLAKGDEVLWALSQQFHYPYAPGSGERFAADLVLAKKPFSAQAEAVRALRSQINMRLYTGEQQRLPLAVLSAARGDGRSFLAANLAIAFSQLGGRTLLVDADMRNPRQQQIFGLTGESAAGLSGILSGRPERNTVQSVPELPSLFVMPVGVLPPNPTELVERPAFGLLMRELQGKFDYVIVDTPAANDASDAAVIAAHCGAALLVSRRDHTKVADLRALTDTLANGPAKIAGAVVNER